jgi:hypothetical protein
MIEIVRTRGVDLACIYVGERYTVDHDVRLNRAEKVRELEKVRDIGVD